MDQISDRSIALPPFSSGARTDRYIGFASYGLAFLLGLILAAYVFPISFLFPPTASSGSIPGDTAQHMIGQRYFIADAWRWPPLTARNLGTPDGVNIAFVDANPFMALILKVIRPLPWRGFEGVGLWYGIAWVLQPIAAVWCVRAAGERRLLPSLAMAVIAVSMPAWWNRFGHSSLTGHFLILFALGNYFLLLRRVAVWPWVAATLLALVALLVHPYLWVMVMAPLCAVPVSAALSGRPWRGSATGAAAGLGVSALAMAALGYLGAKGEPGFGNFGMNLLSPVWPAGSWLFRLDLSQVEAVSGSGWEGYNYLGAGVLVGLVIGYLAAPRIVTTALRDHIGLMLALLALTAIAISNEVGIGSRTLLHLYDPPNFLQAFRSSARMFWPVGYALALAAVLSVSTMRPATLRSIALGGIALAQFMDAAFLRQGLVAHLRAPVPAWDVDAGRLRGIFAQSRSLTLIPSWFCMPPHNVEEQQHVALEVLTIASETALPVNTMYVARWYKIRPCDDATLAHAPFRSGEVRVILPSTRVAMLPLIPDVARNCAMVRDLLVCRLSADSAG